jgi:Fic family protein
MFVLKKDDPSFQYVSERNRAQQYDFLRTAFEVWAEHRSDFPIDRQFLCDLNFYAVQYLSEQPGRYRQGKYVVVGQHKPPPHEEVETLMARFWDNLGRLWERMSPVEAAAYAIWAVNHIHPFMEGNGRSSRALCYFIICVKYQLWLPGSLSLPEQIRLPHRPRYCEILGRMDAKMDGDGLTDLSEMRDFLNELLTNQLSTV